MILKKIKLRESINLNEAFTQPVENLTRGFTDDMKYKLETGTSNNAKIDWSNPSTYFKQGTINTKWSDAFSSSSGNNANNLIHLFIQCTLTPNPLSAKELDSFGDLLVEEIRQMGFREQTNPLLKFFRLKNFELTKNGFIMINNLWSDGYINGSVLLGVSTDKTNHIIFNSDLYKDDGNLLTDGFDTVKAYYKLSRLDSVKELDIPYIMTITKAYKNNFANIPHDSEGHYTGSNYKEVRDGIIYDGQTIVKYYNIQKAMIIGEETQSQNSQSGKSARQTTQDYANDMKKNLNGSQMTDIVKQLIKDGLINPDDLK